MKSTLTLILPIFCFFFTLSVGLAQEVPDFKCGFDELRSASKVKGIQSFEEELRLHFSQKKTPNFLQKKLASPPYVLPVVVHIIHNGGPENISDALILAAIDHLNDGFAAQGYFAQQGATVNTQIQFCLARRDPDGNATIGITRTQSSLTNMTMETEDIQTKDLNRWNPKEYVNIWVVNEITSLSLGPSVAGYAYFPSSHGKPEDGMICEARFFGASPADDAVLIHEMGHYLGLYHTFEGGCLNNDCTTDGDKICDTPPDNASFTACPFNSCNTDVAPGSPFLTDVDDFTADFMDYSPLTCFHFFTAEQSVRMQGSIETARKSLLGSKGCLSPCTQPIIASFSATPNPVVAGVTVLFTNNSSNASNFSWSENGVVFAQGQSASKIFNAVGLHTIVLTASNSDPNCAETSSLTIEVLCPLQASFIPSELDAAVGSTLTFTNTSAGGVPSSFEWSINGQVVSTANDLSFLFQNPGYYTVSLRAIGLLCQSESSVVIKIANPCGLFPEPGTMAYTAQKKLFQPRDLADLPDGSIIQCGEHFQHPMLTKWSQSGNLLWNKETNGDGTITQIEPTTNGDFLVTGELNFKMFIAKVDANGNLLWAKNFLDSPEVGYISQRQFEVIAANPDGSFGFLFRDDSLDGVYLSKFAPDGSLLWSRKFLKLGLAGSLHITKDGTGDFIFASYGPGNSPGEGFKVLFVSQAGVLKTTRNHGFPNAPLWWIQNFDLSVHQDGGYSIFYAEGSFPLSQDLRKFMARYHADGTLNWAKSYNIINTEQRRRSFIRQLPNEKGWLIIDSRRDATSFAALGDILERIDSNGQILWARDLGDTPANDTWVMPPIFESGRLRSVHCDFFNFDMNLLDIYDSDVPMICAPIVGTNETIAATQPSMVALDVSYIPKSLTLVDLPLVFSDVALTKREVCLTILPCPEICGNQLDDDLDGFVDCFDPDCPCFDSDTACTIAPPINNFSAKLAWQSSTDGACVTAIPIIANLNPQQDSIPEILILEGLPDAVASQTAFNFLIFKGDGSNAANPNILNIPEGIISNLPVHPTVADLDKNGIPELILVTEDRKIRIYTGFDPNASPCMQAWAVSDQTVGSQNARVYAADFDGDGIGEVFCGNDIFKLDLTNPAAPVLSRVLNGIGAQGNFAGLFIDYAQSSTAADLLSPADCNGDPDCNGLEIAAGYQIYSVDLDLTDGDGYQIKVQRDLNLLDPNATHNDGYTSVADLNLDGIPEIIVSGVRNNAAGGFYVWNKNGLVQDFSDPSFTLMNGMICVADVFDDKTAGFVQNFPELIVCQAKGLVCLNLQKAQSTPTQPFWWSLPTNDPSGATGATVFDFNGDGLSEIVYRDQDNLRILYGGAAPFPPGVDVERNWFKTITGSLTLDEYPVVADLNNDGEAEIAVTGYTSSVLNNVSIVDSRGRLRVFESANLPWQPARPIWNQYNYFAVNINDDLSVPKVQQKHWLEMGSIGSGNRPFNTHLAQVSSLNPFTTNKIKAPDVSIKIDSTFCQTDSFELYLNICNLGSADLPNGTPLSFYNGDPTTSAALLLFPPILINGGLGKGLCKSIKLKIPATYNTSIFVIINDDGSLPSPFNLATNFPSTDQAECHYENNISSFIIQNQPPILDLGPDITLCKNSVIELTANPNFLRYRWQNGSTSPNFTAYTAGKYWVDAFDACGFRQTDTINILLNTLATLDLPDNFTICAGETIKLSASGFSKYTWSPADSVSCSSCDSVSILASKSITLHLTATEGSCFVSDSIHLDVMPPPLLSLLPNNGACDMPASIIASGLGNGPFNFIWSDSSTNAVLYTYSPGTYTVQIMDQYGCHSSGAATVSINNSLGILANTVAPNCANSATGLIDLTVTGGTEPFQFLWSNNAVTEDLMNTGAGNYSVLATDANGCTASFSVDLSEPPAIQLSLQKTNPNCAGETSGALDLTAVGGTGNLTFSWSNNSSLEDLPNLPSGTYSVIATDANGCTATISEILTEPPALLLNLSTDSLTCQKTSGVIAVVSNSPNTSFTWSGNNGFSSNLANPTISSSGVFTVIATDPISGCTATGSVWVEADTSAPTIILATQHFELPCGQESIALSAAGSSNGPPFQIEWTASDGGVILNGQNTLTPIIEGSGLYNMLITDLLNGCTASGQIEVVQPDKLAGTFMSDSVHCFGESSGGIHLISIIGGTPPFRYSMDGQTFNSNSFFDNLPAGVYQIFTRDANGCIDSSEIEVTQPGPITVDLTGDSFIILGETAHLQAIISPSNVVPTLIEWSGSGVDFAQNLLEQSLQLLQNTVVQITIASHNGCSASDSWLVHVEDAHKVYVPNIISPENAGGSNQVFLIFGGSNILEIAYLNIFDRWGNQVFSNQHFQANDESQGWDGSFRGKKYDPGVFVWVAKVVFKDGTAEDLSGSLTIVR